MANKKNYRKFAASSLAATAAVAVAVPAVSADSVEFTDVQEGDTHYEGIMALAQQDIVSGYADGSFGVYDNVTRQQVAVMLTQALNLDTPSDIDSVLADYEDVDSDSLYAEQIAAVTEAGAFDGNNGKFNPGDEITREQMATVLVSGLGLDSAADVDVNLDNVSPSHKDNVQVVANLGLTNQLDDFRPSEEITRGAFATMLNETLKVTAAPEVESVSAINAKQVEVEFNKAIDADSVLNEDGSLVLNENELPVINIASMDDTNTVPLTGELSEDGKTLTLTAGSSVDGQEVIEEFIFEGRYSVSVIGAEDVNGEEVESYAGFFTAEDVTDPTVSSVERVSPTELTVNFSEPLLSEGIVSFKYADGTDVQDAVFNLDDSGSFGTVNLSADAVEANKEITVEFIGAKDFADNLITPNPATVTVQKGEKDGVAPTVSSLNVVAPNQFEIKFSEEVQDLAKDENDFTINGASVSNVEQSEDDKTKYTITLDSALDGVETITLEAEAVTDLSGEANEKYSKVVEFEADEVAPELASSEVVKEDGVEYLELTFSKSVTLVNTDTDGTHDKITLSGNKVKDYVTTDVDVTIPAGALKSVEESTTTYRVALEELDLEEGATYTLDLPEDVAFNVSDVGNKEVSDAIEFTRGTDEVEADKLTVNTFKDTDLNDSNNNQVVVTFNKEVDGATATDHSNYSIDGAVVVDAQLLDESNQNVVTLTLEEGSTTFTGERNWTISGVVAADGGELDGGDATGTVTLNENTAPTVTSANLKTTDEIVLTFSENVSNGTDGATTDNDFTVTQGSDDTNLVSNVDYTDESNTVTITLSGAVESLDDIVVEAQDTIDVQDSVGNVTTFDEISVSTEGITLPDTPENN